MAETSSLLNCRTRKGIGGSNPPLSAEQKMESLARREFEQGFFIGARKKVHLGQEKYVYLKVLRSLLCDLRIRYLKINPSI